MNAIIIALLGSCLVLAAHGIPIISSLKLSSGKVHQKLAETEGETTEPTISTYYSSELSSNSEMFYRLFGDSQSFYYYQAIQVYAPTSGTYTFTSDSELDTMGFFYDTSFDPSVPTENLISDDDDGGDINLQFRIEAFLEAGHTYILVVTTHGDAETGDFSITVNGPAAVTLMSITPTTSQPLIMPSVVPMVSSSYSSALSSTSGIFQRVSGDPNYFYYFQAIQVTVSTSGTYTFTSNSELDTMSYFYDTSFDPSVPTENLIADDDDGGDSLYQFRIEAFLEAGHTYILVVTTHGESETGDFSVLASGLDTVSFLSITPTTSQPITMPVTEPAVLSSISSALLSDSLIFHRPDRDPEENYYYHAIEVVVETSGTYVFTSDSELDTMGFFYDTAFDPSNPAANLVTEDDDSGAIDLQFQIEAHLEAGHTYVLVITTHIESEIGSFSVSASGPAALGLRLGTR